MTDRATTGYAAIVLDARIVLSHGRFQHQIRKRIDHLAQLGVHIAIIGADAEVFQAQSGAQDTSGVGRRLAFADGTVTESRPNGHRILTTVSDESAGLAAILDAFADCGIGPGSVLVVATQPLFVDSARTHVKVVSDTNADHGLVLIRELLDDQIAARAHRRVPHVDRDPLWTMTENADDPLRRRVLETLLMLGSDGLGCRSSGIESDPQSTPMVLVAGMYTATGPEQHLLECPLCTAMEIDPLPADDQWVLDLRSGVLVREETKARYPLRIMRFCSTARAGLIAMRAEAQVGRIRPGKPLRMPKDADSALGFAKGRYWAQVASTNCGGVVAAAVQHGGKHGATQSVERLTVYCADPEHPPPTRLAVERLDKSDRIGFDRLLSEHRAVWGARWAAVNVLIPDDPAVTLALRFALFQLWCNANQHGESAVGARGISGPGYRGHVFWDADVFVLPAVVAMDPDAAAAMLAYRLHRLPAAREQARSKGLRGARFPWESAADGTDVTPASGFLGGTEVPIHTSTQEEHIVADVAWAAHHYAEWTGRPEFLAHEGRDLIVETARYWAARVRIDNAGQAHICTVIGPDEYHESVDDNAYTNAMARWNLRRAVALNPLNTLEAEEFQEWARIAERLVVHCSESGLYEQFTGYFQLEPLCANDIAPTPFAADVLVGDDRVARSQLIKQPDVLMLHHLVPDEVVQGSLAVNLDYYLPRLTHGSSLSPAIVASLLARAGRADEALAMLRHALRLDLDDRTGTTAAGLHLATIAGVWQAMLAGFAGVRVNGGVLLVDPHLPTAWRRIELRFRCLGRQVRIEIDVDNVVVHSDGPISVRVSGRGGTSSADHPFTSPIQGERA